MSEPDASKMGFEEETFPAKTREFIRPNGTYPPQFCGVIYVKELPFRKKEEAIYGNEGASGDDGDRVRGGVFEGGNGEVRSQAMSCF